MILFVLLFLAYALGSILIATVLQTVDIPTNTTFDFVSSCGVNNCPDTKLQESSSSPSLSSVYTLVGILVAINVVGIISTIIFMDDIPLNEDENDQKVNSEKKEKKRSAVTEVCKSISYYDESILIYIKVLFSSLKILYRACKYGSSFGIT